MLAGLWSAASAARAGAMLLIPADELKIVLIAPPPCHSIRARCYGADSEPVRVLLEHVLTPIKHATDRGPCHQQRSLNRREPGRKTSAIIVCSLHLAAVFARRDRSGLKDAVGTAVAVGGGLDGTETESELPHCGRIGAGMGRRMMPDPGHARGSQRRGSAAHHGHRRERVGRRPRKRRRAHPDRRPQISATGMKASAPLGISVSSARARATPVNGVASPNVHRPTTRPESWPEAPPLPSNTLTSENASRRPRNAFAELTAVPMVRP